jgi:hypothetical protein
VVATSNSAPRFTRTASTGGFLLFVDLIEQRMMSSSWPRKKTTG